MTTPTDAPTGYMNFILIVLGNAILGAPMPMLIILGGLAGILTAPLDELATLPVSVQMLAGLLTAAPMSLFMGRFGRKNGFLLGAALAAVGGVLGTGGLVYESFTLLCIAHGFLGAALVCFAYFRFAAAEVAAESWRPTAISITLGSGLIAAVLGPEIFVQTRDLFAPISLAGSYLAISGIALIGCLPLLFLSLPPVQRARADQGRPKTAAFKILGRRRVLVAVLSGAISQGVMVLMMTPTPLAMIGCGFSEVEASDVIMWHVIAMFAPSFFTGFLISRFGSENIVTCGMLLLAAAAGVAISGIELGDFYLSLILLGLGWNFGFIGATSLLNESLSAEERPAIQGTNDTLVALAATAASFGSGAMIVAYGWTLVALISFPMVFVSLGGLLALRLGNRRKLPIS